jgi:hypothetical protein
MAEEELAIRAVIFQDRGRWLAQCLEHDLCTSGTDQTELLRKVASQLRLQITLDLAGGRQPFQGLPRAPQRFWDMLSTSTPLPEIEVRPSWLGSLFWALRGRSRVQAKIALAAA